MKIVVIDLSHEPLEESLLDATIARVQREGGTELDALLAFREAGRAEELLRWAPLEDALREMTARLYVEPGALLFGPARGEVQGSKAGKLQAPVSLRAAPLRPGSRPPAARRR